METIRYISSVVFLALACAAMTRPMYLIYTHKADEKTRETVIKLFVPLVAACLFCLGATLVAPYHLINMLAWLFAILTATAIALMVVIDWRFSKNNEPDTEG